ncbi:MAG: FHA domain-containing protein [Gammaproteobacteria bacterium]|nr:FHA domain-containing protein [Gammaproteobacteria bacterium]
MAKNRKPIKIRTHSVPGTLYRQKGILSRIFGSSGLEIHIKSQTFNFDNIDDFKAFLAGKTEIPASKMQEMLKRTDLHLKEEIKQLSKVEQTINEKLAATIRDPKTIDSYLDGATMVRFSQDYDWRQIMFELSKQSTDLSEYKLEAVSYYLQYLRSRISIARSILQDKSQPPEEDDSTRLQETMQTNVLTEDDLNAAQAVSEKADDFSETSADLSGHLDEKIIHSEFKRIPRGQTVIVDSASAHMLPMKIASRKFILEMNEPPELISKNGDRYPLKQGENLIGRSTKCSIILNPEFVDVSRQHLIIELYPNNTLHFTDLSSSGTQLPSVLIKG